MSGHLRPSVLDQTNAAAAAEWFSSDHPVSPRLGAALPLLFKRMIAAEAIKGILIEEISETGAAPALVGLGLSVFIHPKLMEDYIRHSRPFVFVDILERELDDGGAVLTGPQIAHANFEGRLNLVVQYMQAGWDLRADRWREVGALGHQTYAQHHSGYRLERALQECWSMNTEIYLMGGYRELTKLAVDPVRLPSGFQYPDSSRTLFYADSEEVQARAPGSTLSYVFQRRTPRCQFTPSEQRLMLLAIEGDVDIQIAEHLKCSTTAVKHTWRNIYEKVGEAIPQLFSEHPEQGRRGPEKRRRVLQYVQQHPEELRPYKAER